MKTRLIPLLGPQGAAEFHAALIRDTVRIVNTLRPEFSHYLFLAGQGFRIASLSAAYTLVPQRGRGLGERLNQAFKHLFARHNHVVIIGTDSPALPPSVLRRAFKELLICDAVLGPCPDGGFCLIGLRRLARGLFTGVRWGSAFAFRDTQRNLLRRGFSCSVLERYPDIDRPGDVKRLFKELKLDPAKRRLARHSWRFLRDFLGPRQRRGIFSRASATRWLAS